MPNNKTGKKIFLTALLVLTQLSACQTNQVTGKRHFQVYGSEWEQQAGAQMYAPLKQSQGGEFILDPALTDPYQNPDQAGKQRQPQTAGPGSDYGCECG